MKSQITSDANILAALSALVLIALSSVAVRAFAESPMTDVPSETVRLDDLNIASPAGVKAAYGRIHAAARQVCHAYEGMDLARRIPSMTCISDAEARAVAAVNRRELSEYAQMKHGLPAAAVSKPALAAN